MSACEIYMPEAPEWAAMICFGLIKKQLVDKDFTGSRSYSYQSASKQL